MKKGKGRFLYSTFAKTLAFLILAAAVALGLLGGMAVYLTAQGGYGLTLVDTSSLLREREMADTFSKEVLGQFLEKGEAGADSYCADRRLEYAIYRVQQDDAQGESSLLAASHGGGDLEGFGYVRNLQEGGETYRVFLGLPGAQEIPGDELLGDQSGLLYTYRYEVLAVTGACALAAVLCFIYLMCAAGHRPGTDQICLRGLGAVPLDLLAAILGIPWLILANDLYHSGDDSLWELAVWLGEATVLVLWLTGCCVDLAARLKAGGWWRNTLLYRIFRGAAKIFRWLGRAVMALPLLRGTVVFLAALQVLELCALWFVAGMPRADRYGLVLFLWLGEKLILIPLMLYRAHMMRILEEGSRQLAQGNLSFQLDTGRLRGGYRRHGENLNRIAGGMARAVEERMRSEHLKTELITNVSHDIKTPLTSIINYADLIQKEKTENAQITEYAQVLYRQSARLKKLIEDLVEASKASTGNLEVNLEPCQVGVLLTQAAGEYQQRLQEMDIDLITRQSQEDIRILADGRLLWRVFDNLMNNICKYAQSNTRVYLSVESREGNAAITLRNISKYPLDVSAQELMERFVRGDRSRHTEGNGLGLSIAQSLTELQGGKMELVVDGDLFKVLLTFPLLKEEKYLPSAE